MKIKKEIKIKKEMKCPYSFTITWAKEFISYLGGNSSLIRNRWCWKEVGKAYPKLVKKAEQFFENAKEGNPSYAVYCMASSRFSTKSWVKKIIAQYRNNPI